MAISDRFPSVRMPAAIPRRVNYGLSDLRGDVMGGITAGGITLPIAIGYGVLSGLGPVAGLYGAVAVGIFASLFGGTRGLVYGPNTAVTVTMSVVVAEYADSVAEAATIAILAGLIQIIFGLLGLGRYASYVPASLISGFFAAFGILIIVKQSFLALGGTTPPGSVAENVAELPAAVMDVNPQALALTAACIAVSVLWRGRLRRLAPAPFITLVFGIIVGLLLLRDAPVIGEIPLGLPELQLSAISLDFFLQAAQPAFIMALLASVQTFIWALRVDAITGTQHKPNREMFGQGLGNMAAGFTGGLAGSVAPGAFANAASGGRSPVAGLTVAGIILVSALLLGPVAERIPLSVLAAVMMVIGWGMIDRRLARRLHRIPRSYALVMILTFVLVLFAGITTAIVIGLVVAALAGSRRLEGLEASAVVSVPLLDRNVLGDEWDPDSDPFQAHTGLVVFPDRVTVASARELSRILRPDIQGHQFSIFDMSRTEYVDDSAAEIISELMTIASRRRSRTIIIAGMKESVSDIMHSMGLLESVPVGNYATDVDEAKRIIRPLLQAEISTSSLP